ncbi:hypothetical protein JCM3766R1_001135 [Sporobolomyces carnicolor]
MASSRPFPSYLLHAPYLAVSSPVTPSTELLQRTLPPSPLYYLHAAPATVPGSEPPRLLLDSTKPSVVGRRSEVYRATSPSGRRVVLKYSQDVLASMHEADDVYVNLPSLALPIPTFYGIFVGNVVKGQPKGMVTVLEDRGQPLADDSFDSLSRPERQYLFDTLKTLHEIHFSHGSFSPSSVVVDDSDSRGEEENRKLTLVGFSQAKWHLCEPDTCRELLDAKVALGL